MARFMGGIGQRDFDCDFAQPGFTAGQYGFTARTEQDHMVRSRGEIRQDREFSQPGFTAGQYGSRVKTEREHMDRSRGRAGQGCDHKVRPIGGGRQDCDQDYEGIWLGFDHTGESYHPNDSYWGPPQPQIPINSPRYRFPREHRESGDQWGEEGNRVRLPFNLPYNRFPRQHRNGGEQWGDGNRVERINLPSHICFTGENQGEWENFKEDFWTFIEINQIRNPELTYGLLRQGLKGPAKDRLQTILKFGNRDPD